MPLRNRYITVARPRLTTVICIAAAAFALGLSALAYWQWKVAIEQRDHALISQSLFLADQAEQQNARGDHGVAMALALEALPDRSRRIDRPYVHDAEEALYEAAGALRERKSLKHDGPVWAARFSPDGRQILTVSGKAARLWDAHTGEQLFVLPAEDRVISALFSADGSQVVTASVDRKVRSWRAANGSLIRLIETGGIGVAALSPTDELIAAPRNDGTVGLWSAKTGERVAMFDGVGGAILNLEFSSDAKRLLAASTDGTIHLWNIDTGAKVASMHVGEGSPLTTAAIDPSGKFVATGQLDGTIGVWDERGTQIGAVKLQYGAVNSILFSPEGSTVIAALGDGTARLIDARTLAVGDVMAEHAGQVIGVALSPDMLRIATASNDGTARIWSTSFGLPNEAVMMGHTAPVMMVQFSPQGDRIVTASEDGTARIWNVARPGSVEFYRSDFNVAALALSSDGKRMALVANKNARILDMAAARQIASVAHDAPVWSVAFSADGSRLLTASADETARVWDTSSGAQLVVLKGHKGKVFTAAFSPDGQRIVTAGDDKTARVWDATNGVQLGELTGHGGSVASARFSPDGKLILTASHDGTARLWDSTGMSTIATLTGHTGPLNTALFSPDGKQVATASNDGTAWLWDGQSGARLREIARHAEWIIALAFSIDGRRIVTESTDGTARVWDIATATPVATMKGHTSSVFAVEISPDGNSVATGSSDASVRLWPIFRVTQDLVDYSRSILPREFTEEERRRYFLQ